jgi:hypothetical protein
VAEINEIANGDTVRHASGAWPCGCDDEDGTVSRLADAIDEEPMAFVGTPCFWQWFPISELVVMPRKTNGE